MGAENPLWMTAFQTYLIQNQVEFRLNNNGVYQPTSYQGKPLVGLSSEDVVTIWGDVRNFQKARSAAQLHLSIALQKGQEAENAAHVVVVEPPVSPVTLVSSSSQPPEPVVEPVVEPVDPVDPVDPTESEVGEESTPPSSAELREAGLARLAADDAEYEEQQQREEQQQAPTQQLTPPYPVYADHYAKFADEEDPEVRKILAERSYQSAVDEWSNQPPTEFPRVEIVLDDAPPLLTNAEQDHNNPHMEVDPSNVATDELGNEIGNEDNAFDALYNDMLIDYWDGNGAHPDTHFTQAQLEDRNERLEIYTGERFVPEVKPLSINEYGSMPDGFKCEAITRSIPTYYRLGYVLEAVANNFRRQDADEKIDLNFVYKPLPNAPVSIPLIGPVRSEEDIPLKVMLPPDGALTDPNEMLTGEIRARSEQEWEDYLRAVTDIARSGTEFFKTQSVSHELLYTTFDAPVSIKQINNLLNKNPNMNALKLIKAIIAIASKTLGAGQEESVGFRLDSRVAAGNANIVEIFSTSNIEQTIEDTIENLIKEGKMEDAKDLAISITYAHDNSLVENIDVASKIDVNAWAVFRQDGATNRMGVDLLRELLGDDGKFKVGVIPNYIQAIIDSNWVDRPEETDNRGRNQSAASARLRNKTWNELIANEDLQLMHKTQAELESIRRISLVLREVQQEGGNTKENRRLANSALGTLLFTDMTFYNSLLVSFMEENSNVHLGKVLSNYLLTITTTVHGITGLSPLDYILVDNVIQGVRGIYYISNLEEDLRPGNFNTLITMQLARQM